MRKTSSHKWLYWVGGISAVMFVIRLNEDANARAMANAVTAALSLKAQQDVAKASSQLIDPWA